jgi:hypothetical protein
MNMNIFILFIINNHIYNKYSQLTRSNIHAIYTFILSLAYLNFFSNDFNISNKNYLRMLYFSLFYSIYDIYYLFTSKINGYKSLIFHHSIIVFSVFLSNNYLYNENNIVKLIAFNYLTEISTPFFNRSIQLVENKKKDNLEFLVLNTFVVLLFGISRVLFIPYFLYISFYTNRLYIIICQLLLSCMNMIWYYKIIQFYKKINYK